MVVYASPIINDGIPVIYNEAVQISKNEKWRKAINEEM